MPLGIYTFVYQMDTRNVQRTGDMFYVYLPTRWSKQYKINSSSKVGVQSNADGSLSLYPQVKSRKPIHLKLSTTGVDVAVLHKLIVASYISPADSFSISLDEDVDFTKVLDQKNLVSLELVEIDGSNITCESSMQVSDPSSLLTTMIRKLKNLLRVMENNSHRDLLERYEEEIDRSRLLIEKSVVGSLVNPSSSSCKAIELHFISSIAKNLESMADHLITLENVSADFLKKIQGALQEFHDLWKSENLNYTGTVGFLNTVNELPKIELNYAKKRIVKLFNNISEILIDWAIVKETENQ